MAELFPFLVGVAAIVFCWATAIYVLATRRNASQNRHLATALFFLGVTALSLPAVFSPGPRIPYEDVFGIAYVISVPAFMFEWLSLAATMHTAVARLLRNMFVRAAIVVASLGGVALSLALPTGGARLAGLVVSLYMVPAFSMLAVVPSFRRAPGDSEDGLRGRLFAVGFAVPVFVFSVIASLLAASRDWGDGEEFASYTWPPAAILFALLTAYGQLLSQRVDLELNLKKWIRRGTLASMFAASAAW